MYGSERAMGASHQTPRPTAVESSKKRTKINRATPSGIAHRTQKGPEGPSRAKRAPRAGGALLSRGASPAVPSALAGLTSGFGTGPGVPPPPRPPARGPRSWHSPRRPRRAPWGPHGAGGNRLARPLSPPPGRAPRRGSPGPGPVSGARLRRSRALHLRPIDQVFSLGPRVEGASRGGLRA